MPLDIFLKIPHNNISRLEAWLYFIASDETADIEKVCAAYPDFCRLYREVFRFRYNPKELVSMFSEALRLLDEGTIEYMIDDMKMEIDDMKREAEQMRQKYEERLAAKEAELQARDLKVEADRREIEQLKARLALLESGSEVQK